MNSKFSDSAHVKRYGKNQTIACKEKSKSFYLQTNDAEFEKIKIDGGIEESNSIGKRCDFLILSISEENAVEIFVELKGKHIRDAKEQLIESFKKYATKSSKIKHYAVIITSNRARLAPRSHTKTPNAVFELRKTFKTNPFIKAKTLHVKYIVASQKLLEC